MVVWKTFFPGMEHYHSPGICFRAPGYFGLAVERPTLCAQVSGSNLACRVSFPGGGG